MKSDGTISEQTLIDTDLCVFVDSNLFLQCKSMQELPWRDLTTGSRAIRIIVCYPIIAEMDKHKSSHGSRIQRRARDFNSMCRKIRKREWDGELQGHSGVTFEPRPTICADRDAIKEAGLDPDSTDHCLVWCCGQFSEAEALLLSNDEGVLLTAQSKGIRHEEIPHEWLLEGVGDSEEVRSLKAENKRYAEAEPQFAFRSSPEPVIRKGYQPISDSGIDRVLDKLGAKYPMKNLLQRDLSLTAGLIIDGQCRPVSKQQRLDYEKEYQEWLDVKCRKIIADWHKKIPSEQPISILIENAGSRPATDVKITLTPSDNVEVVIHEQFEIGIPRPPKPPKGRLWSSFDRMPNYDFHVPRTLADYLDERADRQVDCEELEIIHSGGKADRSLELRLGLWRHKKLVEILADIRVLHPSRKGSCYVKVEATNLTKPFQAKIQIDIENADTESNALAAIERLKPLRPQGSDRANHD